MKKVGTLKELNVKPGDVVQNTRSLRNYTVAKEFESLVHPSGIVHQYFGWDTGEFRIVTRAADATKLWRDMTDAEKGALLLAYHEGKVIEYLRYDGAWNKSDLFPNDYGTYRVRTEPKVETVTTAGAWTNKGGDHHNYSMTFTMIDGHPQWNTAKVTGK